MSPAEDVLLSTRQVRKRYGDCSHMWVERRLQDDPDFPKPEYIAKRRYWWLSKLIAYDAKRAQRMAEAVAA